MTWLLLLLLGLPLVVTGAGPLGPDTAHNFAEFITVNDTRHLFYMLYEAREVEPSTAPLVVWLTGGPGCSSLLGLFYENGPYHIQEDLSLTINPYSWNQVANVLWVDQPVGTGYSYSDDTQDTGVVSELEMANNLHEFLCKFISQHPRYSASDLYLFGESYAGHYIPSAAAYLLRHSCPVRSTTLRLAGIGIGNGLVDPETQYQYYEPYAAAHDLVSPRVRAMMTHWTPRCINLIHQCALNTTLGWSACLNAYDVCNYAEVAPVQNTGVNLYDIRRPCGSEALCYDFSLLPRLLAQPAVAEALGVADRPAWKDCNRKVNMKLVFAGDWMLGFADDVRLVLDAGLQVLVYAGDQDFICNHLGNRAWVEKLDWPGFAEAVNHSWEHGAGYLTRAAGLSYLQVADAGHMVPRDQPKAALEMLRQFLGSGLGLNTRKQ